MARGGVHQGVAADLQALAAYTVEELVEQADGPLLVVLDSIEDPHKWGHPPIRRRRRVPWTNPAGAARGAARRRHGAGFVGRRAPRQNCYGREYFRALDTLKELGVWTVGLDGEAEDLYDSLDYTIPTAFVVGAEGEGLRRLVRETCDRLVKIPMGGLVESLNVSVAAGVALFEAARQRRTRP